MQVYLYAVSNMSWKQSAKIFFNVISTHSLFVHYMPSKSCEHMAYASQLCGKFTSKLSSRNYYTLHLPGGASCQQQIVNEWKRSSAMMHILDCIRHSRLLTK